MNCIESEVSDDPATEIVAQKITSLDAGAQEMLKLAAYLGHSFNAELLRLVAFGIHKVSPNASGIDETTRCI
jgi:predicted ATPase